MDSDAVLALGRKLVAELGLDQSVDTLSRWMAHYITELIHGAETAEPEKRQELMSRCCAAILDLWRHRREMPDGKRPFEDIEPILRALQSLDPNQSAPRYFAVARAGSRDNGEEFASKKWLDIADGLDYSARILIRYCLTHAAQTALDKSQEWIALAEAVGADEGIDLAVVRFIANETELLNSSTADESVRGEIESRLKRLDAFVAAANVLADELRRHLRPLTEPEDAS